MKKEKYIGLAVLTLILAAGVSTAFADDLDREARKAVMEENRAQMTEVFENGTYGEWVALENQNLEERINQMRTKHSERMAQITEENFGDLAEAHLLMQVGDFEGAKALMKKIGFDKGFGPMDGHGKGMGEGRGEKMGNRGQQGGQRIQ
ncbi:hypothetical protein KJ603_00565 [Patescibacteria group bacterium]|nr:hypothetical protein [Patescibacteria group bacterium]